MLLRKSVGVLPLKAKIAASESMKKTIFAGARPAASDFVVASQTVKTSPSTELQISGEDPVSEIPLRIEVLELLIDAFQGATNPLFLFMEVPSQHGRSINSRRVTNPLVRLVEGEKWWEAPDQPQVSSLKVEEETSQIVLSFV
ncbi:hypothetical protein TNCV_4932761 [Trichonephila clavipes]|nr:hypothetical protein TNCV_4932761 [Trichonephila clavipes]